MEVTLHWSNFFVAAAGAAAALAGLVFVTISINLARIIELPGVSSRAAETIIVLGCAVVTTLFVLMPGLRLEVLGWFLFFIEGIGWMAPNMFHVYAVITRTYYKPAHAVLRAFLHQAATLPGVIAACLLVQGEAVGLYWFAAGVISSMAVALFNAWILLVEIIR